MGAKRRGKLPFNKMLSVKCHVVLKQTLSGALSKKSENAVPSKSNPFDEPLEVGGKDI